MKCPCCGHEEPDQTVFCGWCGKQMRTLPTPDRTREELAWEEAYARDSQSNKTLAKERVKDVVKGALLKGQHSDLSYDKDLISEIRWNRQQERKTRERERGCSRCGKESQNLQQGMCEDCYRRYLAESPFENPNGRKKHRI